MSSRIAVLDYKLLGEVDGQVVNKLQLLVHDDRLSPDQEDHWVNAGLAGRLWPLAVVEFYLSHLVVKNSAELDVDDNSDHSTEETLVRSIWEGERLLCSGSSFVKEVVGTQEFSLGKWDSLCKTRMLLETDDKDAENVSCFGQQKAVYDDDTFKGNKVSRSETLEIVGNIEKYEDGHDVLVEELLEMWKNFCNEQGDECDLEEIDQRSINKDEVDLGQENTTELVPAIVHDNTDEEIHISNLEEVSENLNSSGSELECVLDEQEQKDLEEDEVVLLFEVIFEKQGGEIIEALVTLENLMLWAPAVLLEYLQSKVVIEEETEVAEDE